MRGLKGTISQGVDKFLKRQDSEPTKAPSDAPARPQKSPTLPRSSGSTTLPRGSGSTTLSRSPEPVTSSRASGSSVSSRTSQLANSPISAHRTSGRKSPRANQINEHLQTQNSSSIQLARHAEKLNQALLGIFGNKPATFYELIAEINTFPKLDGMEKLDAALNEPNFQKRLIKDIPYLFDFNTRELIVNDNETLENETPQLEALNNVIDQLSEFVSYFGNINSELSNSLQKLLDYFIKNREALCENPSKRAELLEQRGFVSGLSLKPTSVDVDTLCQASSVTREGEFKKDNRFGGSLVRKLSVPNAKDKKSVFIKLGVVYGKNIEPLKYGPHCLNAAILEVGPMLPIRETTALVVEAELLVFGIPVFNSGGDVIDFKIYNAQATLGIKGPEYHYTLAITEMSKRIKTKLKAEAFKTFYEDCLNYEPLIQEFLTNDERRKLAEFQEIKTKNLTKEECYELERILRLLSKEFSNIVGGNLFKLTEINHAIQGAIEFVNYREILGALAILEKFKEIAPLFSAEGPEGLLEIVHTFQNAKRYEQLPKAEALTSLHDLPELKEISSLAAINAYIRRDNDGKSDNWIAYCCIDPPEANQSRFLRRKQGHYVNIKDIHYLVPSIMSRRFDTEVLKWLSEKHPALHMLQWMHVILERSLRLNQLYESQLLQDSALAEIRIPADYIRQELASRKRIREVCLEQRKTNCVTLTIQELLRKVDPILMRFYELVAEQNKGKSIAETFRTGVYTGRTVEQVFEEKYTDTYVRETLNKENDSREPFYQELFQIQNSPSYSEALCKLLFDAVPDYEKNFNEDTVDIFEAYNQLIRQLDCENELSLDEQFELMAALGDAFDLIQNHKSFKAPHHPFITNIHSLSPERVQQLLFQATHMAHPNALKFALKIGGKLTHVDEEGRNPLHVLCERHGAYEKENVLACMTILLANPGVHDAFRQKTKTGAAPLSRLVSCVPKENEAHTQEILEMVFQRFPNQVKNAELVDLCITRRKPTLFAWFVTAGVRPSKLNEASEFIEQNSQKPEIVAAEKLLLSASGKSEFSLSHMIKTAFSSEAESSISLRSVEDSEINLKIRPGIALSLSRGRAEEVRQVSSNGISLQFLKVSSPNRLQIRFIQDALGQACFFEQEFPRRYLQLQNKKIDYLMVSSQPTGIPLTEATEEELSLIKASTLTKLVLLALLLDPEVDDPSKYYLVRKEGHTTEYSLVRTEPYNAIGLLTNKIKTSYISEIFNRPSLMNRQLDKDTLLEFISERKISIFFSFFNKMKSAEGITFQLSEETMTRLNDQILRLIDAIKQNLYNTTALSLLQCFDPEKAKDVQYAVNLSNDPVECSNLLKGRSSTHLNTPKAETQKSFTELAEHVGKLTLDNTAIQGTIKSLEDNVGDGIEELIRLTPAQQSKVLEKISFSVFGSSKELEGKVIDALCKPGFFRIFIRYSQFLEPEKIKRMILSNEKTLTHLDLSGSIGVTDALVSLLHRTTPHLQALILNGTGVSKIDNLYLPALQWLEIDRSEALKHVEMPFCELETLILSAKNLEYLMFYSPSLVRLKITGDKKKKISPRIVSAIESILMLASNLMEFEVPDDIGFLTRLATLREIYRNRMKPVENWRDKDELVPDVDFTEEELYRLLRHNELSKYPASTINILNINPGLLPALLQALVDFKTIRSVHTLPYTWMPKKNNLGEEHKLSRTLSNHKKNRICEISELPNGNVLVVNSDEAPCIVSPSLNVETLANVSDHYTSATHAPHGLFYLADQSDIFAFNSCGLIARHSLPLNPDENITIIRGVLWSNAKTPEIIIGTSKGRLLSLSIDKTNNVEKLKLISDESTSAISDIVLDNETLLAIKAGNTVILYNRISMRPIGQKNVKDFGDNMKVTALQFINHRLACGFDNGQIIFYSTNDFSEFLTLTTKNLASVTDIKSIDAYNFVSANDRGDIYVWNQISANFFLCKSQFKLDLAQESKVFLSVLRNGEVFAFAENSCTILYCNSAYISFESIRSKAQIVKSAYEQVPQHELVRYRDTDTHLQLRATKMNATLDAKMARDLATLCRAQVYESRESNGVIFELINPGIYAAFLILCKHHLAIPITVASNQFGDVFSINLSRIYEETRPRAQPISTSAASNPKASRTPQPSSGRLNAVKSAPSSPKVSSRSPTSPLSKSFLKGEQHRLLKLSSLFAPRSGSMPMEDDTPSDKAQQHGNF